MRFLLSLAVAIAIHSPVWAGSVRVINLGGDFKEFVHSTKNATAEERETAWSKFESKHQPLYDQAVFNKSDDPNWKEKRQKKLSLFFNALPAIQEKMLTLFDGADEIVKTHARRFAEAFPDMPDDLPVYVMPSLMSFNGLVSQLSGEKYEPLFLGVDLIAQRSDDLDVLFSHEFFHSYQFTKSLNAWTDFSSPLWFEGFATYVSGVLNPQKADSVLLMDENLTKACESESNRRDWARQYLSILHKSRDDADAEAVDSDWFRMRGASNPKRRGYCLGLHVVRQLALTHELKEMALWSEERFTPEVERILTQMANPTQVWR